MAEQSGGVQFNRPSLVAVLYLMTYFTGLTALVAHLAATEPLDAPLRWVHISELTDPSPWLSGGELLLTTGMRLPQRAARSSSWRATGRPGPWGPPTARSPGSFRDRQRRRASLMARPRR